jgi:hypothetical protein
MSVRFSSHIGRCVVGGLLALVISTDVAACGGSSASLTASTASRRAAGSGTPSQIHARVQLAECARAHGIVYPKPNASVYREATSLLPSIAVYGQAKVTAFEQACRPYLVAVFPVLSLSPRQRAQHVHQQWEQFAACIDAHGGSLASQTGLAACSRLIP